MKKKWASWICSVPTIALAIGGCASSPETSAEPHSLETMVAGTLTAVAVQPEDTPIAQPPPSQESSDSSSKPTETEPPQIPSPKPPYFVFVSDGDLGVLEDETTARILVEGVGAVEANISDDGQWVAYLTRDVEQNTSDLYAIKTDGSALQTLMSASDFDELYPLGDFDHYVANHIEFIPGTHRLLMNTRGTFEGPGLAKNDDLLVFNLDQGGFQTLFSPGLGGEFHISPDGSQLALVTPTTISLAGIDGGGVHRNVLTFPFVLTYSEYAFYPIPVWAQDSQRLMVVIPSEDPFIANPSGSVWSIPADASTNATLILQISGNVFRLQGYRPILSPDHRHLVYSLGMRADEIEMRILDLQNQSVVLTLSEAADWNGWSPDGQHFLITKGSPRMLHVGGLEAELLPVQFARNPLWRDSERFVFLSGVSGDWSLLQSTLNGSTMLLMEIPGNDVSYNFAP